MNQWAPDDATCAGVWTIPVDRHGNKCTPIPPKCCEVHMLPWGHKAHLTKGDENDE